MLLKLALADSFEESSVFKLLLTNYVSSKMLHAYAVWLDKTSEILICNKFITSIDGSVALFSVE